MFKLTPKDVRNVYNEIKEQIQIDPDMAKEALKVLIGLIPDDQLVMVEKIIREERVERGLGKSDYDTAPDTVRDLNAGVDWDDDMEDDRPFLP